MENTCERCGYIASSKLNLIKHVKDERMCRPILSSISHIDLLYKLQPPPDLTCQFCKLLCKSKRTHTTHTKYHCHLNPDRVDKKKKKNDIASTSQATRTKEKHKDGLFSFTQDIDWNALQIPDNKILQFIITTNQGIVDLFILVHSYDEHKNIKWTKNKFMIFDGIGWTELVEEILAKHLGFFYAYLEECWCDYLMDVRCGTASEKLDEEVIKSVDDFMYNKIVDDESVLFQCGDSMLEYLEALKTC